MHVKMSTSFFFKSPTSIIKMKNTSSGSCPLFFLNRKLGHWDRNDTHLWALASVGTLHE